MEITLQAENEQYIESLLRRGRYKSRAELLDAAVLLLRQREKFVREAEIGIEQLERGELADDVGRRGRERLSGGSNQP